MESLSDRIYLRNQNFLSHSSQSATSDSFAIALRKQKRKELFSKKRHKDFQVPSIPVPTNPTRDLYQSLKQVLLSDSAGPSLLQVLKYLRTQYSPDNTLALKLSKSLNIIQDLANLLRTVHQTSEEFKETLGCICNLASGPQYITEDLFKLEIDNYCIGLVDCYDENLAETAIWCLSNLGADSLKCREKLVSGGTLQILIEKLKNSHKMQNTILWAIRNLIEGISDLPDPLTANLLQLIKPLLKLKSSESYIETLWIFSVLTDGSSNQVEKLIKSKCLTLVLSSLQSNSTKVITPSIRSIGNIAAGTSKQAQILLDHNVLDIIYTVLDKFPNKSTIKKYSFWALSNLTSGIKPQIDIIVKHPVLIKAVVGINDCDNRIRKEAITIAYNVAKLGSVESVRALVNVGIIKEGKSFLEDSLDNDLIFALLDCVMMVLEIFKGPWKHEVICIVKNSGMADLVEKLVNGKNMKIQKLAGKILKVVENSELRED